VSKKHYNLRVSGKVQGVFFRATTKETAEDLGVTGFVRNEPDGTVYAEVEGDSEKLDEFLDWVKKGPPQANVADIQVEEDELKDFEYFEIKR